MGIADLTSGFDRTQTFENLLGSDQAGEYDVADVFGGIAFYDWICGFYFYHEYGFFYAVEPHFLVLIPKAEVEFLYVGRSPPGSLAPQAANSPDAPDRPPFR